MGLLGALGGAGRGMAQVGQQWAEDLKRQRIEELRHRRELDRELRGEDRALAAEGRAHARSLEAEERKRGYVAEDREADHANRKALEAYKADLRASQEGAKPSAAWNKMQEMIALGEDPEVAYHAAYKPNMTLTDPVFGGTQIVQPGTWEPVAGTRLPPRDAQGRLQGMPTFGSRQNEPQPAPEAAQEPEEPRSRGLLGRTWDTLRGGQQLPRVTTQEEYERLKSGDRFIGPDGKPYVKP